MHKNNKTIFRSLVFDIVTKKIENYSYSLLKKFEKILLDKLYSQNNLKLLLKNKRLLICYSKEEQNKLHTFSSESIKELIKDLKKSFINDRKNLI